MSGAGTSGSTTSAITRMRRVCCPLPGSCDPLGPTRAALASAGGAGLRRAREKPARPGAWRAVTMLRSGADDLAGLDARGADLELLGVATTGRGAHRLDVRVP